MYIICTHVCIYTYGNSYIIHTYNQYTSSSPATLTNVAPVRKHRRSHFTSGIAFPPKDHRQALPFAFVGTSTPFLLVM